MEHESCVPILHFRYRCRFFMLKIIGIPRQSHIFKPKMFSRRLSAYGRDQFSMSKAPDPLWSQKVWRKIT